ncbi:DUF6221 family protein [Arthrobacter sp. StoSoilB13]|uniref:DUF6221 family protein n=1 Tax=Arthrobacter sp. StoSoilB13 TaxID=2830993 RepID=UPI001E81B695|nr:DUF6221 family protein [Arthrobacter sp. StoSoilB13]BCW47962.1 hypothetical protein StoSoilB13_03040 [Arthrobacter sp. StoSoilB13]
MTITEFLEARIAEDEEHAGSGWSTLGSTRWETDNYGRNMMTPAAILAECAAKRAIIGLAQQATAEVKEYDDQEWQGTVQLDEPYARGSDHYGPRRCVLRPPRLPARMGAMTKTPQEIIIAALVAKLGGEVQISMREHEEAETLDLRQLTDPGFNTALAFKVVAPPVLLEGELADQSALTDS